jgi:hypothetical protein
MPAAVAAAVVSSMVAEAVVGAVVADFVIGTVASQVIGAVAGMATSAVVGQVLHGGDSIPPTSSAGFSAQQEARLQVVRSAVTNRNVVYGRAMVSGPLVFAASTNDNSTIHLVVALAGHECDAVEEIYFNDELVGARDGSGNVTAGRFAGHAMVRAYLGAADQAADSELVAAGVGWTSDHRLRGVTYLYLRLTFSRDVFPRGIPNIKAVVRGKKLYDPRTATTAWSDNPALAVRDYLTASYGLACASTEISDSAIIAAANICDEDVALAAGGTENRYTCNGVIDLGNSPRQILESLLSPMAGVLTWQSGVYRISAGAYTAPAVTLTADDLRGAVRVRPRVQRQYLFNGVRGTYASPDNEWQPSDFPAVANSTYASQDGQVIYRDIALPMTTSPATAQRLARLQLERGRQGITIDMPCKLTAFRVAAWDVVRVTLPSLGWSAKEFRVVNWQLADTGGVDLTLQEEAAASYDWTTAMETVIDPAPDTDLPDPFTVAVPGVPSVTESLYETREGGGVKARATVNWGAAADAFVAGYRLEYRVTGTSDWTVLPDTAATAVEINDVAPGRYDLRVKAINTLGVGSAYATRSNIEILGLAAAPGAVTGLSLQAAGGLAVLTFDLHPDLDVRVGGKIRVRHSASLAGATWESSVSIGEAVNGTSTVAVLPLKAGTYLLKAEDSSGIQSVAPASISTKQATALAWSSLATVQEDDDFTGTHSDTVVEDVGGVGILQLESIGTIDAQPDFDAIDNLAAIGGILADGTYDFATGIDLGSVKHVRLTSRIVAQVINALDQFDSRAGDIDAWADFDGTTGASADAWVEVRETDDDPAGSPTWSSWRRLDAAEFMARGFDFRARLTTADPAYNIQISELRIAADEIV